MSTPEIDPPRAALDLDQLQEVVTAVGGFALYLIGTVGGALTLGAAVAPWLGYLLLLGAGLPPSAWTLHKAAQRKAAKAHREHFAASRERTAPHSVDIPRFP